MGKTIFQPINDTAVTYFNLDSEPLYGVQDNDGMFNNIIATNDDDLYEKVCKVFEVSTNKLFTSSKYEKVFVMPNHNVGLDKIKELCKEYKIKLTNNYEEADLILTHDYVCKKCEDETHTFEDGEKIPNRLSLFTLWNYNLYVRPSGEKVIIESGVNGQQYGTFGERLMEANCISGLGLNVAYKIDTNECDVFHLDTFVVSSAESQMMDEDLCDTLLSMAEGTGEDWNVAKKIIPSINPTKNLHLIWKFANNVSYYRMNTGRDKNLDHWKNLVKWDTISDSSASEAIEYFERMNLLCKDSFNYLENIARGEIEIHNRSIYTFKVKIKKKYERFSK